MLSLIVENKSNRKIKSVVEINLFFDFGMNVIFYVILFLGASRIFGR